MKVKKTKSNKGKTKASTKKLSKNTRVSTGIKNFDNLIQGGFEQETTNLLVGGPGSGKTIFATQFLLSGMKNGEACLYVTFEEKKNQFYKNMKKFGWDLEAYEKKGLFTFLEYTPIKVKTMLEEGGGEIETIVLKKKIKRMAIDSITSFTLLFNDELKKREAALQLFNMLKKWYCTTLLTFEGKPSKDEKVASRTLEFESDSIIFMHFIRKLVKRKRYIEVLKMRGTDHSKEIHDFTIGTSGIEIKNTPSKLGM